MGLQLRIKWLALNCLLIFGTTSREIRPVSGGLHQKPMVFACQFLKGLALGLRNEEGGEDAEEPKSQEDPHEGLHE